MLDCQKHLDAADVVQYSGSMVYILPCTVAFQMFMNEIKAKTFKFIAAFIKNTPEK
jgi:hypothetical protein